MKKLTNLILIILFIFLHNCKTLEVKSHIPKPIKKIKTDNFEWLLNISPNAKYLITGNENVKKNNLVNFRNKKGEVLWNFRLADSHSLETSAISKNESILF